MGEYRTRSPLLTVAERSAELVSKCYAPFRMCSPFDHSTYVPTEHELEQHKAGAGLSMLLRALGQEAALSTLGAIMTRWDIAIRLATLRRLYEEEVDHPEILERPIAPPIIVTGLPRSGTTFLQTLLAEDPENRALRCWEVIYPYPDRRRTYSRDIRAVRFARQVRCFNLLAPDLHRVHPLNGSSLQECTEVTALVFQSLRYDSTHHVPSYRRWLDAHGHLAAYAFHRRFLQHLQSANGRKRWVLKSPDHVFALSALKAVYPDARIVFMHRDPMKVLPSNAQLIEILRAPFSKALDPVEIGRQSTADLALAATNMVEASRASVFSSKSVFHLHFLDLIARPTDAVERLYRHFGLRLSETARERMACHVTAKPNGGYAKNIYRPGRHGIDPDEIEQRFRGYMDYFDIPRERSKQPIAARPRLQPIPIDALATASIARADAHSVQ